ncbi:hypothetical protein M2444_001340 [Paenibacillus sp. PastF-3]|nr:hypothetical protein [Paenibacillus sp. PastF-3]
MTKDNNPEQMQNQDLNEKAEIQNSVTREFLGYHTGNPNNNRPVNESAARVSDDQNSLPRVYSSVNSDTVDLKVSTKALAALDK